MENYISMARDGNSKMREMLSNAYLMNPENEYENPYKGKRGKSYGSLAAECDGYCRYYWNASAADVVYNRADEPNDD